MTIKDMDEIIDIFIEARDACEWSEKVKEILGFF
jgi:hypothetical protein